MPKFLLALLLLSFPFGLYAQTWEVGASIGGAGYMGDINQHNPLKISGLSGGGFIKRNFNPYFSIKGNLNFGKIGAADSTSDNRQQRERNLSFTDKLIETSLIGEFNFMHYIPGVGSNRFTPFIYLGVGLTAFAPRAVYDGRTYGLRPLQTEGQAKPYAKSLIAIPYGAGVKYNIGGKWSLIADLGYRYTNSDYIDDVSGLYADRTKLVKEESTFFADRSGEKTKVYTGFTGTQRGDLRKSDTYLFLNLSISFTFITEHCYYEQ